MARSDRLQVPNILPLITERRILVTPTAHGKVITLKDKIAEWKETVNQRVQQLKTKSPDDEEAEIVAKVLKQELVAAFITALQKNSRPNWLFLSEALNYAEPYRERLSDFSEVAHYLERIYQLRESNQNLFVEVQIMETLTNVFPKIMAEIKERQANKSDKPSPSVIKSIRVDKKPPKSPRFLLPNGKNPYDRNLKVKIDNHSPKLLTLGDLNASLADVALQAATREAIWAACLGTTALALTVDLPYDSCPTPTETSENDVDVSEVDETTVIYKRNKKKKEEVSPALPTSRDAVEYFAKCKHLKIAEFRYFNVTPGRHFNPYDLVEVPQDQIQDEHFIFSSFGVLHVLGNGHSETFSLAEWQKDSVLWSAASKIPFFKNYLIKKIFLRWRANAKYKIYARIRHDISVCLLQSMPCYGAALLQVMRLCQELLLLDIFPVNSGRCLSLREFEDSLSSSSRWSEVVLERFFRFCRIIVETTSGELHKKIKQFEAPYKQSTTISKESHSLINAKKQQRREVLNRTKHEASFLGNYVLLVKQLMLSHLIQLMIRNASHFVQNFSSKDGLHEGFFKTTLNFSSELECLVVQPSKLDFHESIKSMFSNIPTTLTKFLVSFYSNQSSSTPPSLMQADGSLRSTRNRNRSSNKQLGIAPIGTPSRTPRLPPISHTNSRTTDACNDVVTSPDLKELAIPLSEEERQVLPTPPLLLHADRNMVVSGQMCLGQQFNPLADDNLAEKLENDKTYQSLIVSQWQQMEVAFNDIDEFLERIRWIEEIYKFCQSWTDMSIHQWKDAPALALEHKLNELRQWTKQMEVFEESYQTDNKIFLVDCSHIQQILLRKLETIYNEMCSFIETEAVDKATAFCDEMKIVLQNMKNKQTTLGEFAEYAKNIHKYRNDMSSYQQLVEYIRSLFEIVRMINFNASENQLEESVVILWDQFLTLIQEALEFVNIQAPLITQSLDLLVRRLEEEAKEICIKATTGKFLDSKEVPTTILIEMTKLRERFYEVQKQLHQASKWKESITGEPYDLSSLSDMASSMDLRHELWKYFEVSSQMIDEWKATLFKKFNARLASDKIVDWQHAVVRLKRLLPDKQDDVCITFERQLTEFERHLPCLFKLSHEALKAKHWQQIFLAVGHEYDPSYAYTVNDIICLNLQLIDREIDSILAAAIKDYGFEEKLATLWQFWEGKEFKLAKHIPESILKGGNPDDKKKESKGKDDPRKNYNRRNLSCADNFLGLSSDGLDILIESAQLKFLIEDSRLSLQMMLSSASLTNRKADMQMLESSLSQVEEIVDLWFQCQNQWLFLLKIFDNDVMQKKMADESASFKTVHDSFVEFMRSVVNDPKILSIINKPRGDRNYRLHQGDRLVALLNSLIQTMENILKMMGFILEDARIQFPRLYFLSDRDLIEMLAISRNPTGLVPFVRKCFNGINDILFELPETSALQSQRNPTLNRALNADKLEAVKLLGPLNEEMTLCANIHPQTHATSWLSTLEQYMRSTLQLALESCLQARLEEGCKTPIQLLETEIDVENCREDHWMRTFPSQCVLLSEAVMWQRAASSAVEKEDKESLNSQSNHLSNQLHQYITVLREVRVRKTEHLSLLNLLENLVVQSQYQRDVTNRLVKIPGLLSNDFEWKQVFKYQMEIHSVLNAGSDVLEPGSTDPPSSLQTGAWSTVEDASRYQLGSKSCSNLSQSKTIISTGYRFGKFVACQMDRTMNYGYEFFGCVQRLVVTPLTERAYLSLFMASARYQCGLLIGPSGTGKTETVSDLAKSLGQNLVTFSCSDDLTLPMVNRYLKGLLTSGSWGLFDNCGRLTEGMMSVIGQYIGYLSQIFRILSLNAGNQYRIRGQPDFDRKANMELKEVKIRRNSLITLHSLPPSSDDQELKTARKIGYSRQTTVPHGFNEEGLQTYFEEPWIKERDKRETIEREIDFKKSEIYKSKKPMEPPSLLYEHVTQHRKPKPEFHHLNRPLPSYKASYLGSLLFDGSLIRANANYGCFFTLNTESSSVSRIPINLRASLRSCAMVAPDTSLIIETYLYYHGFTNYKTITSKINSFFDLISKQLPRRPQYEFGLRTKIAVLRLATVKQNNEMTTLPRDSATDRFRKTSLGSSQSDVTNDRDDRSSVSGGSTSSSLSSFLAASDSMAGEEGAIVWALLQVLVSKMTTPDDVIQLKSLLRDVFPGSIRILTGVDKQENVLANVVKEKLSSNSLTFSSVLISKIFQLLSSARLHQGVILTGPAGSGKTTCYKVLSEALNQIHDDQQRWKETDMTRGQLENEWESSRVDVEVLFPNVFSFQELFGGSKDGCWESGLLAKTLVKAYSHAASQFTNDSRTTSVVRSVTNKWIVLDGAIDPKWVDAMNSLFDVRHKILQSNCDVIQLHDKTNIIFEMEDLRNSSPLIVSRCGLVHFGADTVTWKLLVDSWCIGASERWVISSSSLQMLKNLVSATFEPTIGFLQKETTRSLLSCTREFAQSSEGAAGQTEISAFLNILSSLMDQNISRENFELKEQDSSTKDSMKLSTANAEESIPNYTFMLKHMFAFAFIWAFGGGLHENSIGKFDEFARETLKKLLPIVSLPESKNATLFDYYIDCQHGQFLSWDERPVDKFRQSTPAFVWVPEFDRYSFWIELLLRHRRPVLISGNVGVGKSSLIENHFLSNNSFIKLRMSENMTSARLQQIIETYIVNKDGQSTDVIGKPCAAAIATKKSNERRVLFIDDFSSTSSENYGAKELVRQILSRNCLQDRSKQILHQTDKLDLLAAVTNPGTPDEDIGGIPSMQSSYSAGMKRCEICMEERRVHCSTCHTVNARVLRMFTVFNVFAPSKQTLFRIYRIVVDNWLNELPAGSIDRHLDLSELIVRGALDIFDAVVKKFHPTALHPFQIFTLHKLHHFFASLTLFAPKSKSAKLQSSPSSERAVELPTMMTETLVRLWYHESLRTYGDQICLIDDQKWFKHLMDGIVMSTFKGIPAISEIVEGRADLTNVLFSKYIKDKCYRDNNVEELKRYVQERFANVDDIDLPPDLVFFDDVVRHIARLSRVMAKPGGHALMISTGSPTTRLTLVRLTAQLADFCFFEFRGRTGNVRSRGNADLHLFLKQCSHLAGIRGKPTVLFINENVGKDTLADVCAFMKDGTCPGLYMESEMRTTAGQVSPGQSKLMNKDKIRSAFGLFLQKVRKNLHLFVCLRMEERLSDLVSTFPSLLTTPCSINIHQSWNRANFVSVAERWLRDPACEIPVPWDEQNKSEQIVLVADVMAFIHETSEQATRLQYIQRDAEMTIVTPKTFREFVHIFKRLSVKLAKNDQEIIKRFESGLNKIKEASEHLEDSRQRSADMEEEQRALKERASTLIESVEQMKIKLAKSQEACLNEEASIAGLSESMEVLKINSREKYGEVNPTYKAALESLEALDAHAVDEVRSYRLPPDDVQLVMEAVCLLFGVEKSWPSAKLLLLREKFFEDLIFFNKDNITEEMSNQLAQFIDDPKFKPESVANSSVAAARICQWVRAVHSYHHVTREMKPELLVMEKTQLELNNHLNNLGKRRLETRDIRSALENKIQEFKMAASAVKEMDKQIQAMERYIAESANLLDNVTVHQRLWKSNVKEARARLHAVIANSVIAAACVVYFGPLDQEVRSKLLLDWLKRCEFGTSQIEPEKVDNVRQTASVSFRSTLLQNESDRCEAGLLSRDGEGYQGENSATTQGNLNQSEIAPDSHGAGNQNTARIKEDALAVQEAAKNISTTSNREPVYQDITADLDQHHELTDGESLETGSMFPINLFVSSEDFSLVQLLGSIDETYRWEMSGCSCDPHDIDNALILRTSMLHGKHSWLLLVDPDQQAETWLRMLSRTKTKAEIEKNVINSIPNKAPLSCARPRSSPSSPRDAMMDARQHGPSVAVGSPDKTADAVSFHIRDMGDRPDDNLFVVSSDDPELASLLMTSLVYGMTILVTNAERKILPDCFHRILSREFVRNGAGQMTVSVGNATYICHPNFHLVLATSMPLFHKYDNMAGLPTDKLVVVDLSASQDSVVNKLLNKVLSIERPEYENQRRSLLKDILKHHESLKLHRDQITEKVLNLTGLLMEDRSMLESLKDCQVNVDQLEMVLGEAGYLQGMLDEKRKTFHQVASNGAMLYQTLQRISILNPSYFTPLESFTRLFAEAVVTRRRDRDYPGSSEARCRELMDVTTKAVFRFASSLMYEQHFCLFAFLAAFRRSLVSKKITQEEFELFINGADTVEAGKKSRNTSKPEWMSQKVWNDCCVLESTSFNFRGLQESIIKNNREWNEYFKLKFDALSPVPGLWMNTFTVFQKCLLWRICVPHKLWEACWPVVTHEFGGLVQPCQNHLISEVYENSTRSRPIVLFVPGNPYISANDDAKINNTRGVCFSNPTSDILQLAKEMKIEGKVHVISCGADSQLVELERTLEECMNTGHWIVVENLHLSQPFTDKILKYLQIMVSPQDHCQDLASTSPTDLQSSPTIDPVHSDFRLWITTCLDQENLPPGMLIRHGQKITCDIPINFHNLFQRTFKAVEKTMCRSKSAYQHPHKLHCLSNQMSLAMLHSLLVYQQTYSIPDGRAAFGVDCHWSPADLSIVAENLGSYNCPAEQFFSNIARLSCGTYTSQCQSNRDVALVSELTYNLMTPFNNPNEKLKSLTDSTSMLPLLYLPERTGLNTIVEPSSLGIPIGLQEAHVEHRSQYLLKHLASIMGSPGENKASSQSSCISILKEIQARITDLPSLAPPLNSGVLNPVESFLQSELSLLQHICKKVLCDVGILLEVVQGKRPSTPSDRSALKDLSDGKVPPSWESDSVSTDLEMAPWMNLLRNRFNHITCQLSKDPPLMFEVGAFCRPDRFFQAIHLHLARQCYRSLHAVSLDFKFLPGEVDARPLTGVYVRGFRLHNATWNRSKGCIGDSLPFTQIRSSRSVKMPVVWIQAADRSKSPTDGTGHSFDCSVFATEREIPDQRIGSLPVPCLTKPSVCVERRVYMSSDHEFS